MSWTQTQKYLNTIALRGLHPGLERIQALMRILGHPEKKFKSIHVTGTNGKGSVCAMLESILRSSGVVTGLYTSPHLLNLAERISVEGRNISLNEMSYWVNRIRVQAKRMEPEVTYFEMLTAVAFCHFAQKKVELGIVEVGLGGKWDATNVIPSPEIGIITNVTLEHTNFLGNTVQKIAREKAGILKTGTTCITQVSGAALKPIIRTCRQLQIPLLRVRNRPRDKNLERLCALKGNFQGQNIALVIRAAKMLKAQGWPIDRPSILRGLQNVSLPGRFEWKKIESKQIMIPVLMDGAHNPAAVNALMTSILKTKLKDHKCILIFNALKDKNVQNMLKSILKHLKISKVLIPRLSTVRTTLPGSIQGLVQKWGPNIPCSSYDSVHQLWLNLQSRIQTWPGSWILATGSFYLVGDLKREMDS